MWEQWIRDLLCRLYQRWGLSCTELDEDPDIRAGDVDDNYREKGAPIFPDIVEKAKFLDDLTELEAGLTLQDNSLNPLSTTLLNTMISDLRKDLS
jgi:hypothetical protein